MPYPHKIIEKKWQELWDENQIFKTPSDLKKPKYYILDMFPYPSASGLHVGHTLGYTATDILARKKRMSGYAVLHPMGWDAFGLPAEQHAIETGEHPAQLTYRNIANYKRQLKMMGYSYDWDREITTCDPNYYKWTQSIFSLLYKRGLAYQAEIPVNWCPALKTVLANEEVLDGKSERGGHPVYRVPMKQWMLKITEYAKRLLEDLEKLDWPDSVKDIQKNWIGESQGALIRFPITGSPQYFIEVFTTRPDTLFGVGAVMLAPEHPLVEQVTTPERKEDVFAYRDLASRQSDFDRGLNKSKTGIFTGSYAIHPLTQEKVPIWVADYVLPGYGSGAVMSVPAHDERDYAFANNFKDIPVTPVILPSNNAPWDFTKGAFTGEGVLTNSGQFNGKNSQEAKSLIIHELEHKNLGFKKTNYRLRDWLFSRQRYWGEPLPILKDSQGRPLRCLTDDELPLTLPEVASYQPTEDGQSPLGNVKNWIECVEKDGTLYLRETDTMPGSAGSSWYFLRYCDPQNTKAPFDLEKTQYWMPVDLYIGGQEHAVGHLLYARFWTKVLFDAGLCPVDEPFKKLVNQGMICKNGAKMSKSKGNGVNPDAVVEEVGADALRVYEMFMGPLSHSKEWDDSSLAGIGRFLNRIYKHFIDDNQQPLIDEKPPSENVLRVINKTIKKVGEDIESLSFNTAISQLMICLNTLSEEKCKNKHVAQLFLKILCPFAPHLSEELWQRLMTQNQNDFVSLMAWPLFDPQWVQDDMVTIGVQVQGKMRGQITLPRDCPQETAVDAALKVESIQKAIQGKPLNKIIYVSNRILNLIL